MEPIRVLLAAASPLVRYALAGALSNWPRAEIVGEATSLEEVIGMANEQRADIILLHLDSETVDWPVVRKVVTRVPDSKLIVVAEDEDDVGMLSALAIGARGYSLRRHVWPGDLRSAITAVARGHLWLCPASTERAVARLLRQEDLSREHRASSLLLTEREMAVLNAITEGISYGEIAGRLYLSRNTIKTYMRRIMMKLSARTRQEAVVKAVSLGILPDWHRPIYREEELLAVSAGS